MTLPVSGHPQSRPPGRVTGFGLITADLDEGLRFYREALGFETVGLRNDALAGTLRGIPGRAARTATMRLGATELTLTRFDPPARPYAASGLVTDLWFQHLAVVVTDIAGNYQRAIDCGATPITRGGPISLPPASGGALAVKFRDPDGHPLEFLEFPPERAPDPWRVTGPGLRCLGIDHSALVVSNVHKSEGFYRRLGLDRIRSSENVGPEQACLDALDSARVQIRGLQSAAGPPGVELLEYEPGQGRPVPAATDAVDIAATHVSVQIDDLDAALSLVQRSHCSRVSKSVVDYGDCRAVLVCDPDGHLILLTQHVN